MSPREELEDRLDDAKTLLWRGARISIVVPIASAVSLFGGFVAATIIAGLMAVPLVRYRRAKRELAALDKPPTARLLR